MHFTCINLLTIIQKWFDFLIIRLIKATYCKVIVKLSLGRGYTKVNSFKTNGRGRSGI